jgi:hypothetical protein
MRAKNWTALHLAQRTTTLTAKVEHYERVCAEIGEPRDRHQRRTLTMARKSLKAARTELLLVRAREGNAGVTVLDGKDSDAKGTDGE